MKRCPRCKDIKTSEAFSKSSKTKDGLHGYCRDCVSTRNKKMYAARGKESWSNDSICVRCRELLPKSVYVVRNGRRSSSCPSCEAIDTLQATAGNKQCCTCKEWLNEDLFYPSKKHLPRTACAQCTRDFHAGRKDKTRARRLMKEYGITIAQYDGLIAMQKGDCPVCKTALDPESRSHPVDHAHSGTHAGRIRAIVHRDCNRHVLWKHDNPAQLRAAADLIENPLTDWYVPGVPTNQKRSERSKK